MSNEAIFMERVFDIEFHKVIEIVIVPLTSNKIFTNYFFSIGLLIRSCIFNLEFLFSYQDDLILLLMLLYIVSRLPDNGDLQYIACSPRQITKFFLTKHQL